ncbi:hypothetical protein ABZX95_48355 [Streptomyces sp. NPDC004232]|uniref:TRADD-N-associated membrane domain-containing protein n=1 Tax=Streptomyces sp. NPDC004232 TaxID=3154454 RepID=UPI0033AA6040
MAEKERNSWRLPELRGRMTPPYLAVGLVSVGVLTVSSAFAFGKVEVDSRFEPTLANFIFALGLIIGFPGVFTLTSWALGLLDGRTGGRAEQIELELNRALGLTPVDPSERAATTDDRGETAATQATPAEDLDRNSVSSNYVVNITEGAAGLADWTRAQNEGQARLITKYYAQGYSQARTSFILSVTFAILGFAILAVALIQALRQGTSTVSASTTGVVGIINEAVSVLFFTRADKARDTMMQMIDKLRSDYEQERKFIAGLAAIEQVSSVRIQDALRATTALAFTEAAVSLTDLMGAAGALPAGDGEAAPRYYIEGPRLSSESRQKSQPLPPDPEKPSEGSPSPRTPAGFPADGPQVDRPGEQ